MNNKILKYIGIFILFAGGVVLTFNNNLVLRMLGFALTTAALLFTLKLMENKEKWNFLKLMILKIKKLILS